MHPNDITLNQLARDTLAKLARIEARAELVRARYATLFRLTVRWGAP